MKVSFAIVILGSASFAGAFSPLLSRTRAPFQTSSTQLRVSSVPDGTDGTEPEKQKQKSPAAEFGSPLNEDSKKTNKFLIGLAKTVMFDGLFPGDTVDRAYARFYALETIARMPYFSYLSVLHLYETLGWWRRADYIKMHFAESWNELHHLLIMEDLGGNTRWFDRFVAQHAAFFYYWTVVGAYLANPSFAYNLNQAVEEHAYDTYSKFTKENEEWLKTQPAPAIAKEYYRDGDLYMFDEMHTSMQATDVRRPKCDTLYDVFCNIRDDEMEHVKTMIFLQEEDSDLMSANVANGIKETDDVKETSENLVV